MATNAAATDLDVLLAHERWAARLARALVHDDDLAEDVLQEARVSFWRKGPDDPTRARAWLGRVIRNLVRSKARARQRQHGLQRELASSTEHTSSAEDLAHRLEGHRLLATLVGQLREPFREVVLLRYYEGISGADIARRLGIPAGTVRWRIKIALQELRASLDERHDGQRGKWLVWMVAMAATGDTLIPVVGGAVAGSLLWGGAAVLAVVLLVGIIPSTRESSERLTLKDGRASDVRPAATPVSALAGARVAVPTLIDPSTRPADGRRSSEEQPMPAWALMPGFPPRVISGRVTSGGHGVAGAKLRLSPGMLTHGRALDRHTTAGPDGRFAFSPQVATNWFLTVSAPDLAAEILYVDLRATEPRVKPRMDPPDSLVIELGPCRVLARGQVHESDGGAIAGARVKLTRAWNNGGTQVSTDESGRYQICVPPGNADLTLVAEADGYGTVETLAKLDQTREMDFELEPGASVSGRAIHEKDSSPLPAIKLTLSPTVTADPNNPPLLGTQPVRLETGTDSQGAFHLSGLAPGNYRITLEGDDVAAADQDRMVELGAGEHLRDVELRLASTALVEGTVMRGGKPAPDVMLTFQVRGVPHVPPPASSRWPMTKSGPDGRVQRRLVLGTVVEHILGAWPGHKAPKGFVVDRPKLTGMVIEVP